MNFLSNSSIQGSVYYNTQRINELTGSIKTRIEEMNAFKTQFQQLWKNSYDDMLMELENILTLIEFNPVSADKRYNDMIISKYDNFQTYVYNNDINALDVIKCNTERTKTLRAKRKNIPCPNCGGKMNPSDLGYTCDSCDYSQEHKPGGHTNRTVSNNTKHICKQLDALTGARKAPANIVKIIDYIIIWLTEPHYIMNWLKSREDEVETDKKTKRVTKQTAIQKWMKKYSTYTGNLINEAFFMKNIPRDPSSMMDYNVFKLFMDEFYAMLEYAHRCSMEAESTMSGMNEDEVFEIFKEYAEKNQYKVPGISDSYTDSKGISWDVGRYVNMLSLNASDINIKKRLEKLFERTLIMKNKTSLTIPGLMFNYKEVYTRLEVPPKKYCYQQEYSWIMNRTFHTPFVSMDKHDKDAIVDIILRFNEYYKDRVSKQEDKTCNSPLYCCTIICVINLPYFQKYQNALKYVPVKDNTTIASIKKAFFEFELKNLDYIKPFKIAGKSLREIIDDIGESHALRSILNEDTSVCTEALEDLDVDTDGGDGTVLEFNIEDVDDVESHIEEQKNKRVGCKKKSAEKEKGNAETNGIRRTRKKKDTEKSNSETGSVRRTRKKKGAEKDSVSNISSDVFNNTDVF